MATMMLTQRLSAVMLHSAQEQRVSEWEIAMDAWDAACKEWLHSNQKTDDAARARYRAAVDARDLADKRIMGLA